MAKHKYKLVGVEPTRERTLIFTCTECELTIYVWRYPLQQMLVNKVVFRWLYISLDPELFPGELYPKLRGPITGHYV